MTKSTGGLGRHPAKRKRLQQKKVSPTLYMAEILEAEWNRSAPSRENDAIMHQFDTRMNLLQQNKDRKDERAKIIA